MNPGPETMHICFQNNRKRYITDNRHARQKNGHETYGNVEYAQTRQRGNVVDSNSIGSADLDFKKPDTDGLKKGPPEKEKKEISCLKSLNVIQRISETYMSVFYNVGNF